MGSLNRFTAPPLVANWSSSGPPTWHRPHPAHPVDANASQTAPPAVWAGRPSPPTRQGHLEPAFQSMAARPPTAPGHPPLTEDGLRPTARTHCSAAALAAEAILGASPGRLARGPLHSLGSRQPATTRILPLDGSAMSRSPAGSAATPDGPLSLALVAGPRSPENPLLPLPATV